MGTTGVRGAVRRVVALRHAVWVHAVALWTCAYAALVLSGLHFSTDLLRLGWQFPIPGELVGRPVATALSTTVQPPLWILTLGATMRWVPLSDVVALQLLMFTVGATVVALASRILQRVGVSRRLSVVAAFVVGLDPNLVGNLFTPAYELPTAALVLAMVCSIPLSSGTATTRSLYALAASATALVMVRTLFHPVLLLCVLLVSVVVHRHSVRRVHLVTSVVVPLVLVLLVVLRNAVLVGTPAWTSWEGMNLLRSVQQTIAADDLERAHAEGRISGIGLVEAFSSFDRYAAVVGPCGESGSGVLERPDGPPAPSYYTGELIPVPNFNSRCYGPVFRQARSDAIGLIVAHPDRWLVGRLVGLRTWFTNYPEQGTVTSIAALGSVDVLRPGTSGWNSFRNPLLLDQPLSLPQIALFGGLVGCTIAALRRMRRGERGPADTVLVVSCVLYLVALVVGVVFELGEQSRFRWPLEPVAVVALVGQLPRILDRRTSTSPVRAVGGSPETPEECND